MIYPINIFTSDPSSDGIRPFIIFIALEIQSNVTKMKDWKDENTVKIPKGGFILPFPNGGLVDSVTNDYNNSAGVIAGWVNKTAEGLAGNFADDIKQITGAVPDPKFTQVYMGSQPRTWSGTWVIVPQSLAESIAVELILFFIKHAAAPDHKSDPSNKVGYLIQPWVFKIVFSNPLIQKAMSFDKMALTSYSINYFAQGYASTYWDMMPKQIELNLNFSEYGIKRKIDWMF